MVPISIQHLRCNSWSVATLAISLMVLLSGMAGAASRSEPGHATDQVDAGPIPVLTLSLEPNALEAQVTQSQLGAVTFQGTATVDQMRIMSSTVSLAAVVNSGWPVVVSPQTFEFQGPGVEDFQVTVIVPPATSSLLTGNVIVTGSCKAPGLAPVVAACSAVVTVAPYYLGRIVAEDGNIQLDPGDERRVELTVHNDGNAQTTMRLFIDDKPEEVRVSFSETELTIMQDEFQNVTVTLEAVSGANAGDHTLVLVLEATTEDGDVLQVARHNMTVYVPSLKAKLGNFGVLSISILIVAVVVAVALWRTGRLSGLKGLGLPRRSRTR